MTFDALVARRPSFPELGMHFPSVLSDGLDRWFPSPAGLSIARGRFRQFEPESQFASDKCATPFHYVLSGRVRWARTPGVGILTQFLRNRSCTWIRRPSTGRGGLRHLAQSFLFDSLIYNSWTLVPWVASFLALRFFQTGSSLRSHSRRYPAYAAVRRMFQLLTSSSISTRDLRCNRGDRKPDDTPPLLKGTLERWIRSAVLSTFEPFAP